MKILVTLPFLAAAAGAAIAAPVPKMDPPPHVVQSGEDCQVILQRLNTEGKISIELDSTMVYYPCRALTNAGLIAKDGDSWILTESARAMQPAEFAAKAKRAADGKPAS